jgi:hypothetical protein
MSQVAKLRLPSLKHQKHRRTSKSSSQRHAQGPAGSHQLIKFDGSRLKLRRPVSTTSEDLFVWPSSYRLNSSKHKEQRWGEHSLIRKTASVMVCMHACIILPAGFPSVSYFYLDT